MTKPILAKIPKLYEQEKDSNPIVYAKYFTPWAGWTWYVTEYDQETQNCFGLVVGNYTEWGYFNLEDLNEVHGPFRLNVERDIHFTPARIKTLVKGL